MGMQKNAYSFFGGRNDRPDAEAEDRTPNLKFYFKLLGRKFGKLLSLNLMMLFQIIPVIAAVVIYFFGDSTLSPEYAAFTPLMGAHLASPSPATTVLLGALGGQLTVPYLTPAKMIAIIFLVLFTVITWGWQNVGATYDLRSFVRGDSSFVWSDYFYAIRRNLRQGFLMGIIDVLVIFTLVFDYFYFGSLVGTGLGAGIMYLSILVLAFVYATMRFYLYLMLITFDLSIKKLFKNALIFTVLGFKRNLAAMAGILVVGGINFALIFPSLSAGFSLPLILPLFYFLGFAGFTAAYAAYPNIQRYMIDAYVAPAEEESTEENAEEEAEDEPKAQA